MRQAVVPAGNVAQYEKKAFKAEERGQAEPSLVELTPLPNHLPPSPPQTSQEGVMSWLTHAGVDASPPQSHVREEDQKAAVTRSESPPHRPSPSPQPGSAPPSQSG